LWNLQSMQGWLASGFDGINLSSAGKSNRGKGRILNFKSSCCSKPGHVVFQDSERRLLAFPAYALGQQREWCSHVLSLSLCVTWMNPAVWIHAQAWLYCDSCGIYPVACHLHQNPHHSIRESLWSIWFQSGISKPLSRWIAEFESNNNSTHGWHFFIRQPELDWFWAARLRLCTSLTSKVMLNLDVFELQGLGPKKKSPQEKTQPAWRPLLKSSMLTSNIGWPSFCCLSFLPAKRSALHKDETSAQLQLSICSCNAPLPPAKARRDLGPCALRQPGQEELAGPRHERVIKESLVSQHASYGLMVMANLHTIMSTWNWKLLNAM